MPADCGLVWCDWGCTETQRDVVQDKKRRDKENASDEGDAKDNVE